MKTLLQQALLAASVVTALFFTGRCLGVRIPSSALITSLIVILLLTSLNAAKAMHHTRDDNQPSPRRLRRTSR